MDITDQEKYKSIIIFFYKDAVMITLVYALLVIKIHLEITYSDYYVFFKFVLLLLIQLLEKMI